MPKTLTIRSDLAWDLAHARAKAEGKTLARVVEDALGAAPALPEEPARQAGHAERLARIDRITREIMAKAPSGVTSDHRDMYDEHGLPR